MRRYNFKSLSLRLLLVAIIAGIIFLPWFIKVYAGQILDIFAYQLSTLPSSPPTVNNIGGEIGNFANYLPPLLWLSLLLAIGWGLWRTSRKVALFALWWLLILFATNPQWFNLPGSGIISNFTLFIGAYFPASLFIGAAAAWLIVSFLYPMGVSDFQGPRQVEVDDDPSFKHLYRPYMISTIILFIALWGARHRISDVQPELGTMVTNPDQRAMSWINANLPTDTAILINSFSAFNGTTVVGSDAGWWLPLFTTRQTNVPPINYIFEEEPWSGYRIEVVELNNLFYEKGMNHPDVLNQLESRNIKYIYIGQRQGNVNNPVEPYLEIETLLSEGNYKPIYHQDRVWILKVAS